ncbi:MAG: AMP-dependent synthetase, partial [Acutalibacteraceae bacterium]
DGIGEIYVKGDYVMMAYYNDEEATKSAFDGEWFKTGDYGYIDNDGYLFFTGRKKNLIILSNGKNVSPEEIESELLATIDYVKEVIVYDENKVICAEFFLDESKEENARELLKDDVEKVNNKLADFKRIRKIKIRDEEFPKTTSMKIKRHLAKEPATV